MSAGIFPTPTAAFPYLTTIHMGGGALQDVFKKGQ